MPKIDVNGVVREMTAGEIAEMERMNAENPLPEPSAEERMAALEAENAQLREAVEKLLRVYNMEV